MKRAEEEALIEAQRAPYRHTGYIRTAGWPRVLLFHWYLITAPRMTTILRTSSIAKYVSHLQASRKENATLSKAPKRDKLGFYHNLE